MLLDQAVESLRHAGCLLKASTDKMRVADVESRFGRRVPRLYGQLLECYLFSPVDVGGIFLFGNDSPDGDDDISVGPFRDKLMSAWLRERGFLQVGRPDTGSYDPICFDGSTKRGAEEQLVRLDHEAILQGNAKVRVSVVAPTLAALLGVE